MIQIESRVDIVDNSGAKFAKCVKILSGSWRREAGLGDLIIVVIYRQRFLKKKSLRKKIISALIIGLRRNVSRLSGHYIRWTRNSVILFKEDFYLFGTKVFSVFPREIFLKNINSKNFSKQIYRYIRNLRIRLSYKNSVKIESSYYMSTLCTYETIFEIPKLDRITYHIPFHTLNTLTKLEWLHYIVFTFLAFGKIFDFTRSKFSDSRKKRRMGGSHIDSPIHLRMGIEPSFLSHPDRGREGTILIERGRNFYFVLRFHKIILFKELFRKFFLNYYSIPHQMIFENNLSSYEGCFPIPAWRGESPEQYAILFSILNPER